MRNSRNGDGRRTRSSRQFPEQNQHNGYRNSGANGYRDEGNYDRDDHDTRDQGRNDDYYERDYNRRGFDRSGMHNQSFGDYDREMGNDYGQNSFGQNQDFDRDYRGNVYNEGSEGSDWRRHEGAGARWSDQYGGSRGVGNLGRVNGGMYGGAPETNDRTSGYTESEPWRDTGRRGASSFDINRGGRWGNNVESMRGKGPKGYRRSDERIEELVNDSLTDDDMLDASGIEVSVKNGEVTLSGTVSNRQAKRRAEDLAESVSGVMNVENRIRIGTDTSDGRGSQERTQESEKSKSQNKNKTHHTADV